MDDQTQNIEDGFELLPDEARTFLYKGPYNRAMQDIIKEFALSEDQRVLLNASILGLVTDTAEEGESENLLEMMNIPKETLERIKEHIAEFILKPLIDYVESELPDEEETDSIAPKESSTAPSPSDMLARLNQTLTKPTTLAPTKREYVAPSSARDSISEPVSKPSIDPYRELPEK